MAVMLVLRRACRYRPIASGSDPGKVIEGMFMGADSKSVRVLLDNGQVSEVPIADAVCAWSSRRGSPRPPPPASGEAGSPNRPPRPAPAPRPGP